MSEVKIVKTRYGGWDNCIELSNGIIDLIATTDVGPRIIRYGFIGKENELCQVEDQMGRTGDSEWNIYGGHRLWHSPENMPRSYELDNSKVEYEEIKNGIILRQEVEEWAQIKKEIEITLCPNSSKATLLHRLVNKGAWPVELAVWALTVVTTGGKLFLPQVTEDTGLLPNRMISLWPYTRLNDPRVYWGEKYITLEQNPNIENKFKFGLPNEDGWAAYLNGGRLFVKQFEHVKGALYPDFGASSFETFTCDYMLEIESLSPLVTLKPEEKAEHIEDWYLYADVKMPESEDEIDKIILPYIK